MRLMSTSHDKDRKSFDGFFEGLPDQLPPNLFLNSFCLLLLDMTAAAVVTLRVTVSQ